MSTLVTRQTVSNAAMPEWWPILLGLTVLYVPTLYGLFNGLWATEEQAHGPIIFALSIWLIYRLWPRMMEQSADKSSFALGWVVFALALALYVIGRSQQVHMFEIGSLIWMLAAILLIKRGGNALKVFWFPLFFMLFMIPLPGTLVIMLTMPMKMAVSFATEHILYWAKFPIARNGVILQIGQYQLLVANACAGLQTLLTLEALGLFYLNVVRHPSVFRNVTLAILIIPISFAANVIRVMALALITYYFGDAAGQGFLHGFAGIVLFLSALILTLSVDALLQHIVKSANGGSRLMKKTLAVSFILGLFMVLASALTLLVTPTAMSTEQIDLEAIIPREFSDWKTDLSGASLMVSPNVKGEISKIYDRTLSRTYINRQGERVMLAIAYGRDQSTDLHIHRPEVCYASGGFEIEKMTKTFVNTTVGDIPVMHVVAKQGIRNEPITYWVRVGDSLTRGWFEQKLAAFTYGLRGQVPDGLLFRISTISNDEQDSYRIQQKFLTALLQAVRTEDRYWLIGRMNIDRRQESS